MAAGAESDFDENATVIGGSEAAQELENIAVGATLAWPQQSGQTNGGSPTAVDEAAEIRRMTSEARARAGRAPADLDDPLAVVPKPAAVVAPAQSDEEKLAVIRQMTNEARLRAGRPTVEAATYVPDAVAPVASVPITSPERTMDVAGATTVQSAVEERHAGKGPSGGMLVAMVGALALVVVGVIYFLGQGSDDATVANQAVVTDADSAEGSSSSGNVDGSGAAPAAGDDSVAPEPGAGSGEAPDEPEAPVGPATIAISLNSSGLGIVDFGAGTAETIDALTAQLGPFKFDSRWRSLAHPGPNGAGYADRANNPSFTFFLPQYRCVCWGDVVMLCTTHGRVDATGTFLGWEQAHVGAAACGNTLESAPELGTTPGGNAVGTAAADLVASEEAELGPGPDGTIVFGGVYRGRVVGAWPTGANVVAGDQAIQCIDAGARPQPSLGVACWTSIADGTPVNAQARALLAAAIKGRPIPFIASRVPNGPGPENGFDPFDATGFRSDLGVLDAVADSYTLENTPDLVSSPDRGLGGTSCGFAGDVT